jgi:hypothetical protein
LLAVVALAGAAVLRPRLRQVVPLGLLALAAGLHLTYQLDVWHLYWMPADGGPDALARAVAAVGHWYAFPAGTLVALVAAGLALGAAVTVSLARTALGRPAPDRSSGPVGADPVAA